MVLKSCKKEAKLYFESVFCSRVAKSRKSDPPELRQVGSRLGAVAFFTFSLCLQKGIKKAPKSSQNGCPGLSKGPQSRQNDPQSHHNGSPTCRSRHFGLQNGTQSHQKEHFLIQRVALKAILRPSWPQAPPRDLQMITFSMILVTF